MKMDISELTAYKERFNSVFAGEEQIQILALVGNRGGATAVRYAADYPEASHKPLPYYYMRDEVAGHKVKPFRSKFKTAKQAYYVVVILGKQGKIPTKRSGLMGKSLTSRNVSVTPAQVVTEVGTNIPYSPYVIGEEKQSHYHEGTWLTLEANIALHAPQISNAQVSTFTNEIDKRLSSG